MKKYIAATLFLLLILSSVQYNVLAQARPVPAPVAGNTGDDDSHEEGSGAFKYWQDLERKTLLMNARNGINQKNRQHFKVAEWQNLAASGKLNRTTGSSTNGNWSQVVQSASSVGMGRVECVAFSPANSNTFFIGTGGGGMWRTNNNGTSYFPVTDGLPSSGVTSIVIDPANANNMYILTGSGLGGQSASSAGVFRSTDGGSTFYPTGLSDTIGGTDPLYGFDMKMHPTNANILFCATNRGLYRTQNAGVTWTLVLDGELSGFTDLSSIFDIEFKPGDPSVVYASYYGSFYYSKLSGDAGSWTRSPFYSGYPSGFTGSYASRIAVSAAAPNSIHIASGAEGNNTFDASGSVYYLKATYNGAAMGNAITIASAKTIIACTFPALRSGGGRLYGDIYVSQTDETDLMVGGLEFYASSNGGTSWVTKSYNCTAGTRNFHVDVGSMITVSGGNMYVTTDGGIYRQTENYTSTTAAWTNITADIEITQLYKHDGSPQDADYYLYANQDNDVHLRNSPANYLSFIGGDGTACVFDKTNKDNFYATVQNGEFMRRRYSGVTTDITPGAGATNGDEAQYSGVFNYSKCLSIDEGDFNTLYAIKRSFYKSTNQGTAWTRYDIPGVQQPNVILRVGRSSNLFMYAVETDWFTAGSVYVPQVLRVSTNGGTTWTNITANLPANILISDLAIDPGSASRIYITCYGNAGDRKVYRSLNTGTTWTNLSDGLPNVDIRCVALVNDAKKGVYVGTDLGVYYRDNNFSTWTRFSNGLPIVQIMSLYVNSTLQTISAGTFGRGIFVSDLFDPAVCPPTLTLNSIYFNNTTFGASSSITSAGIIYPGAETNVTFSAGNAVVLQPGFYAQQGSGFRATAEGCNPTPVPYKVIPVQRGQKK